MWTSAVVRGSIIIVALVVIIGAAVVIYQQGNRHTPTGSALAAINAWATAAETGDLATARDLLVDEPLHRLAFQDRWPRTLRVYGIVPGHVVSNVTQQGQSTTATVHFRAADGAVCLAVLVDAEQRVTILQDQGQCAFPPTSEVP